MEFNPQQEGPINIVPQQPQPAGVPQRADPLAQMAAPVLADPLAQYEGAAPMNIRDEESIRRRSSMYAFPQALDNFDGSTGFFDGYAEARMSYEDTIRTMGDEMIRQDNEAKAMEEESNNLALMAGNAYDPQLAAGSRLALQKTLMEAQQEKDRMKSEKKWAESIVALRDEGDMSRAELEIYKHDTPDIFDNLIDIQASRAELMKAIEDKKIEIEQRNVVFTVTDIIANLIPMAVSLSQTGNYESEVNNFWDWIFPGERMNHEMNNAMRDLMAARTDKERKRIVHDVIVPNVAKQNTFFGGTNKLFELQRLSEFINTPTATETNLWAGLANVPTIYVAGAKAFSVPFRMTKGLAAVGAHKKLDDVLTKVLKLVEEKGPQAAAKELGIDLDELNEAMLVSALNSTKSPRTPPIAGYTPIDRVRMGEEVFDKIVGELQVVQRLNEAEEAAIIADYTKRGQKLFNKSSGKRTVQDVSIEAHTTKPGTQINRVSMTLGVIPRSKTAAKWFASADEAVKFGKKLGFPDAQAVPMSGGRVPGAVLVGDEVQWTSSGMDMFPAPKKITNILDKDYVTVEGSNTGVPIKELQVTKAIDVPGQYGVKFTMPLDETGRSLTGTRVYQTLEDKMRSGPASMVARFIGGAKVGQSKELFPLARIAADKKNKINAAFKHDVLPKFHRLNRHEQDVLETLLTKSEREEKWFSDMELKIAYAQQFGTKSNPTKFLEAYQVAEEMNDLHYYLINVHEQVARSARGIASVSFNTSNFSLVPQNGKVIRAITEVPNEAILDVNEFKLMVDKGLQSSRKSSKYATNYADRMSLTDLQAAQENGYVIIRLEEPAEVAIGGGKASIRNFLVKADQVEEAPLSDVQVGYRAGGHRMYAFNYYAKRVRRGEQPWGEKYLKSPLTPTGSVDRASGLNWVTHMNKMIDEYKALTKGKSGKTGKALEDAMQKHLDNLPKEVGRPDAEEFIEWMKDGGTDDYFELVGDREMPSGYNSSGAMLGEDAWGDALSGISTYQKTNGRMFLSSKGAILRSINDWDIPAETLDAYKTLNQSMIQIARMTSLQDFKIRSVSKWISSYEDVLDLRGVQGLHPMRIFLEAKFKPSSADSAARQGAAELQRAIIKRQLGWKSEWDLQMESAGRQIVEFVAGEKPGKWADAIHRGADWWVETKPVNSLMGLTFDAFMGVLNPRQMFLQVQTSFGAMAIDVTKGSQAMFNSPFVMWYMRKGGGKIDDLNLLIKRGVHKSAGFDDPKEYIDMMQALARSGWTDNMLGAIRSEFGPNAALSIMGKNINAVREGGRAIVNTAEEINRINAWQMAWRLIKERTKPTGLKVGSPRFIEKVSSLADTLSGNMSEASAAAWQKNVLTKLPTQFMPFMMRWHEVFLQPELTPIQRVRFALGQTFMYGVNGLPVIAPLAALAASSAGETPDIQTLQGALYRGFWDNLIFYATGADVRFSDAAGIGMYPADFIAELFNMGRFGDTSTMDMVLGPTGQVTGDFVTAMNHLVGYISAESGTAPEKPLSVDALIEVARNISTMNNAMKAFAVWRYGQYTNRKGEVIADELPSQYGFMAMLGLAPADMSEQTVRMAWLENRKTVVDEWAKRISVQRQHWADAFKDGDYARADNIKAQTSFMMRELVPPSYRKEVRDKVEQDKMNRTVIESVTERVNKLKAQDEQIERLKGQ